MAARRAPCGWVKDKYGVSWQVVPIGMEELFSDPDPRARQPRLGGMMKMKKLDLAELRSAAEGVTA